MVQAAVFHNVCARCFSAEWTPVHVYHLSSHSASFTLFHQNPGTSLKRHNLKPRVGNLVTNPPRGQNGIKFMTTWLKSKNNGQNGILKMVAGDTNPHEPDAHKHIASPFSSSSRFSRQQN